MGCFVPLRRGAKQPIGDLDAAVCCSLFLLTCALLMTSSHTKAAKWNVYNRTAREWELKDLKTVQMTAAQVFANSAVGFTLSGVNGDNGLVANGVFTKTTRIVHSRPVYEKLDGTPSWCYFSKARNNSLATLPHPSYRECARGRC